MEEKYWRNLRKNLPFVYFWCKNTTLWDKKVNCARNYMRILRKSLTIPFPPKFNMFLKLRPQYQASFSLFCTLITFYWLHFSEITCITQRNSLTFLSFLTDNQVCFQDYRAKKSKKCSILLGQFEEHIDFFGRGEGGVKLFLKMRCNIEHYFAFFAR